VWQTHVGRTKSEASEAPVPVLEPLRRLLETYRRDAPGEAYIFAGERRGTPLNLANLARRVIIPALATKEIRWKGWHAFRRGLGSNLHELGVDPMLIQTTLRHSDVRTTMEFYVVANNEKAREAMAKLDEALGSELSLALTASTWQHDL
jgi:integrase